MTNRRTEFAVASVAEREPFSVVGRCGAVPVRVGDVFDRMARFDRPRPGHLEDYARDPICLESRHVRLRIARIHSYGRDRDLLDMGMTGLLVLEGDQTTLVGPDWVLSGDCRRTERGTTTEAHPAAGTSVQ